MEESESQEGRFQLKVDLPRLQEIASYSVALSIWNSHVSRSKPRTESTIPYYHNALHFLGLNEDYRYECDEMVESVKMPTSIEKMLKNALKKVAKEMIEWLTKLHRIISVYVHHSNFVWFANGTVDYKSSVMKILSTEDQLSTVQKFSLMCEFCLKDEIVKFPLNSLPPDFSEDTNFSNVSHLIEYWFYYRKNELHKIPRDPAPNLSLYGELALDCSFRRWEAYEYLWHHMDSNEQESVTTEIFHNHLGRFRGCIGRLLSLMSAPQQRRLFSSNPTEIIWKLICNCDSVQLFSWIWNQYKDLITNEIFVKIVICAFQSYKLNEEEWMNLLVDVWDAASEPRKIYAVKKLDEMPLRKYANSISPPSPFALEFLCKFLSTLDADSRKRITLESVCHFKMYKFDLNSMNKLMMLCLPNIDDQLKFKKEFADSIEMKYECVELINCGYFGRLNVILEFYLPTSNDVEVFKKMLLESNQTMDCVNFLYRIKAWNMLCKFISEVYGEDEAMVVQTKKRIIRWYLSSHIFIYFEFLCPPDIDQLIQIVESVFTENEVATLKHSLFHNFKFKLETNCSYEWYRSYLNEMYFRRFVKWCVGDVLNYEDGSFINIVFVGALEALNRSLRDTQLRRRLQPDEPLLFNLDQFLLWYLENEEKVKEYKRDRAFSPIGLKICQTCSEYKELSSFQVIYEWLCVRYKFPFDEIRSNILQRINA